MLTISSRVDVMTRIGRAMADPTRARILMNLIEEPGYPAELAADLELTRTNVSNHLACLRGCGLIDAEPDGRRTAYRIADPHLAEAIRLLVDVVVAVDDGDGCLGEGCPLGCCGPADDR